MADLATTNSDESRLDAGRITRSGNLARKLELWVPLGVIAFIALMCYVWPDVYPVPSPINGSLTQIDLPLFSAHHLLGTDPLGNDLLSRLLYGGRVSLAVGFGSATLGLLSGGALGMWAGYMGGVADVVISRILDVFLSFPSLALAIAVAAYLGPSEIDLIWAISFFSIPAFARMARVRTLRLRDAGFVVASRLCGVKDRALLVRHLIPSVLPEVLTYYFLYVSVAMIVEASLSYLGLGVRPPAPSWGNMLYVGQQNIYTDQTLLILPGIALFITVLALNLLSDALRARLAQ